MRWEVVARRGSRPRLLSVACEGARWKPPGKVMWPGNVCASMDASCNTNWNNIQHWNFNSFPTYMYCVPAALRTRASMAFISSCPDFRCARSSWLRTIAAWSSSCPDFNVDLSCATSSFSSATSELHSPPSVWLLVGSAIARRRPPPGAAGCQFESKMQVCLAGSKNTPSLQARQQVLRDHNGRYTARSCEGSTHAPNTASQHTSFVLLYSAALIASVRVAHQRHTLQYAAS